MSNLKNNFASKLTSVVKTAKKAHFVYTASFADGRVPAVIRTSNRDYVSVTQITCGDNRTDFLFSSKPTASLSKAEQYRVVAVVQVQNPPAPQPVVANKVTKHKGYSIREQDQRIGNEIVCSNFSVYDDEGEFLHRAKTLDAAKDWIDAEQAGEHDSPAPEPVVAEPTIIDLKDLSLEQVSEMYRNGTISEALTEVYIELWNQGPHMTRAQLSDGVIRNYLAPEPVKEITKASATTAGFIEDQATGNVRGVIRQYGKVIWIEPKHSETRQEAVAKARAQLAEIGPESEAERRNRIQIDHGYDAYAREEGHSDLPDSY